MDDNTQPQKDHKTLVMAGFKIFQDQQAFLDEVKYLKGNKSHWVRQAIEEKRVQEMSNQATKPAIIGLLKENQVKIERASTNSPNWLRGKGYEEALRDIAKELGLGIQPEEYKAA